MTPKLTLLLVYDHHLFCEGLATLVKGMVGVKSVSIAFDVEEAVGLLGTQKFDLVLMDLKLNDSKTDAGRIFDFINDRQLKTRVAIVTSWDDDEAVRTAKKMGAIAFYGRDVEAKVLERFIVGMKRLPLPCFIDGRVREVVNAVVATEMMAVEEAQLKVCKRLSFKCEGERHYFDYDDILYIEGSKSQSVIYTKGDVHKEKIVVSKRLGEIEAMLPSNLFLKSHKSWIVNMKFVKTQKLVDGLMLRMYNDELIPIARDRVKAVDEALYYFDKEGS